VKKNSSPFAKAYTLNMIQERGLLFIKPADKVYDGMIIGLNKYDEDMEVLNVYFKDRKVFEITLEALQEAGTFMRWAFVGGTALRFLFSIPRLSEDLDFSLA